MDKNVYDNLNAARLTALRQVGELVYATHTGTPTDSEVLLEKLQEIDVICGKLAALKEAGGRSGVCAACGAAAKPGDRFCRDCGSAL